ncbi:helix-turn-helix domain-containing protein [Marinicrinis sediminis]|uniref:Helix-turn-helix domain-containing protein n=1 Tax=Marinicrinis sediminis TaxID=1652465 RepID=A0ABW5R8W5_9BACL
MENNQLAKRIRAFRKLKGLTQTELASELGISISVLGAVERGNRKADPELIHQLCERLNIDKKELLG